MMMKILSPLTGAWLCPLQVPYLGLIQQTLWACPGTPMLLLEVPHVSLRLQLRAQAVDDVAHAAAQILWRHAFGDACFVAHSYGTFCVSRICQLHRSLVHSMVRCLIRHTQLPSIPSRQHAHIKGTFVPFAASFLHDLAWVFYRRHLCWRS
jgi:hypothetical protein